jgi:hypothetical protein
MELALDGFALRMADQPELVVDESMGEVAARGGSDAMRRGVRHVQESVGETALLQVLEIEPWSRVPERHAVLIPRRDHGVAMSDGIDVGRGVWR